MKDLNSHLTEIFHLASEALVAADEAVKRQAIGDISCAIASILPVDHAAGGKPAPRRPGGCPGRKTAHRAIAWCEGYVCSCERQGRKLVGEVERESDEWRGRIFDGDEVILEVSSACRGKNLVSVAMRGAMHEMCMCLTHMRRYRQNRAARRRAVALSPEAELAATVARQESDDELAQRLENA